MVILCVLFFIGVVSVIFLRLCLNLTGYELIERYYNEGRLKFKPKKYYGIACYVSAIISSILFSGMIFGSLFSAYYYHRDILFCFENIGKAIVSIFFLCCLLGLAYSIFVVSTCIVPFHNFTKKWFKKTLVFLMLLSGIILTIPITNYFNNIEYKDDTLLTNTLDQKLVYFYNVPVGSSDYINGIPQDTTYNTPTIVNSSDVPFWYLNESDGDIVFSSAPTQKSSIILIEEDDAPYVEIKTYRFENKRINHNNNKEKVVSYSSWNEYNFYLPEKAMQYILY